MPFLNQITAFINDTLKAGSLNKEKLQPAKFHPLASVIARRKAGSKDPKQLELLPAIVAGDGTITLITADNKVAIQVYHKLLNNAYSYVKKSHGDGYDMKSVSEMNMVVFSNSKLTGKGKEVLEPVVLFGMPQRISSALLAELKIDTCLITPTLSITDALQAFRQEYPQSDYFLNEQMSMFIIRYKIEMTFSQACVDQCLCD